MKRLLSLFAAFMLLFGGCSNKNKGFIIELMPDTVTYNDPVAMNSDLQIIFTNNTEELYPLINGYTMDYYDDGEWVQIPFAKNVVNKGGKPDAPKKLMTGESLNMASRYYSLFEIFDFDFVPGKYRLNLDDMWYGEFEIT